MAPHAHVLLNETKVKIKFLVRQQHTDMARDDDDDLERVPVSPLALGSSGASDAWNERRNHASNKYQHN